MTISRKRVRSFVVSVACAAWAALSYGRDVVAGGVTFRLPEMGEGVCVVENGKVERLFRTYFTHSDERDKRFLTVEWTKPNRIERLDSLPGRTVYRVTYPVRDTDALQCSAVYRFLDGVPGVTVTAEVTALKTVRFHNWSMSTDWTFAELGPDGTEFRPYPKSENPRAFIVWCREKTKRFLLARKDDGRTFWYDPSFRVVDGHCVLSGYGRKIASGGLVLEAGQSVTMTRTAGRVLSPGDEEKIALLQGRTVCDGREGPVLVCRLPAEAGENGPDWTALPVVAERGEVSDYRPRATNQWQGPKDLSFTLKAAYDKSYLHLLIDVTDDLAVNKLEGKTLYLGDSVQFGIDPLFEKMTGGNYIDLLAAVAGRGPRLWCVTNPNPAFQGPCAGVIRNRSRLRAGGIVYELSIPWDFLKPFNLENGSFGMSFAVIDQDNGANYETWMGITDGVFGGRDCSKLAEFALEGIADLSDTAERGKPQIQHSKEELLALHGRVAALRDGLAAKCAALAAKGRRDDYLAAVLEMTTFFLDFERADLDVEKVWQSGGDRSGEVPVTDAYRNYIYRRFHFNLAYLEKALPVFTARAEEVLAGKRPPVRFTDYAKGVRPVIEDGGFKVNGRELLLYGPNTWLADASWRGLHKKHVSLIARTGFNLFNLFHPSEPLRTELMRHAEAENIYCSFGDMAASNLNDEDFRKRWEKIDSIPNHGQSRFGYATPNLVFQTAHPESFEQNYVKAAAWTEGFRKHLVAKFGSLAGINEALGTAFKSLDEINFAATVANPGLKYACMRYRLDTEVPRETRHIAYKRKRFDNLPTTTHYSTLWNITGLDPIVQMADFERVWSMVDVVGFDGGCPLDGTEFFIDFAGGCFDIDLARSFHPGKPIANNEGHTIPDGAYRTYDEKAAYLSQALPFFLGQNAESYWLWCPRLHSDGDYAFTMANTYHASLRLAAELRQSPEEIASFRRTPEPPFKVLNPVPSMTDQSSYVKSLYGVYAGCSFTGWAVRYLSERRVDAKDFGATKLIVVPDARRVSDATFDGLAAFAKAGGRVVVFGREALLKNEYGWPRPERAAVCDRLFRREALVSAADYAAVLGEELRKLGVRPPVAVTDAKGKQPFGVLVRQGRTADGRETLLVSNLLKKPAEVRIPGRWRKALLEPGTVSGRLTLAPGETHVLVRDRL